jgi:uncharacterized membrane protein YedE/YeeE
MKNISFMAVGILFGIIMTKSEAISWFRIHEMFRFESFHMYGIIGTAVILGATVIFLMKKSQMKTLDGKYVAYTKNIPLNWKRHILAGSIFGLGWAITGCCPGPIYVLIGNGFAIALLILAGALLGTFVYGLVWKKLPH